jgi:hypothetical protein
MCMYCICTCFPYLCALFSSYRNACSGLDPNFILLFPRSYITWKSLTLNDMWGILSLELGKSQCYSSTKMMTHDCLCVARSNYTICQPTYHKASTCIAKGITWHPNKLHMLFSSTTLYISSPSPSPIPSHTHHVPSAKKRIQPAS